MRRSKKGFPWYFGCALIGFGLGTMALALLWLPAEDGTISVRVALGALALAIGLMCFSEAR